MCNARLFLAVLVFAGVTYSQTDSFYVVPSAPTYKDSLSLVIVVHSVPCYTQLTYGPAPVPGITPFGTSSFSFDLFYYSSQKPITCPECNCRIQNDSLVFKSGPLPPGSYTVSEVVQPLTCNNQDSFCVAPSIEIGGFNVSGSMTVANRLPGGKTLQKSMSGTVYNVRGELISRPTNQYLHGICIVKMGDGTKKTFR
jgi:hypothetical protein